MRNLWHTLILIGTLFAGASAHAAGASPTKAAVTGVTISCTCGDTVGHAYVEAVKEILAKDAHFQQMDLQEGARRGAIRVHIISMPLETADGAPRAVLSIVYTHDGVLVHQFIETCTHIPISDCAMNMVHELKELETSL